MNTTATELTHDQQADVNANLDRVNQSIDESVERDAILALCARLQAAAIKCDDYHLFVSYAPHVDALTVYAHRLGHEYTADEDRERIIDADIYLDGDNALNKLTALIDQLQRLGIDV